MKITNSIITIILCILLSACSSNSSSNFSTVSKANIPRRGTTSKDAVHDKSATVLNSVKPIYPEFARNMKIEGEVILDVEVFEDGSAGEVIVRRSLMSGPGELDEKAIQAIRKWQFTPASKDGVPISSWGEFSVLFQL